VKSIAWAILLATAFAMGEYREVNGDDIGQIGKFYGPLIVFLALFFLMSLVP
jgi:hypothetical protein